MIRPLKKIYCWVFEHLKGIRITGVVIFIGLVMYHLIFSFMNHLGFWNFVAEGLKVLAVYLGITLGATLCHALFGKWIVLEQRKELTDLFFKLKFPRFVKFAGERGSGKDSTVSAIVSKFRDDLIERNRTEMDHIRKVCYIFDFARLHAYLDVHFRDFYTNYKGKLFTTFNHALQENSAFVHPLFADEVGPIDILMEDLAEVRKNPKSLEANQCRFKYNSGLSNTHYLTLLLRYSLLYVRDRYIPQYVVSNQPFLETDELPAKIFSTNYVNIQHSEVQWSWPMIGGVIIVETEADGMHPNIGVKGSAMKSGMRNFKAFSRHLLGEDSVWIQVGQRAGRTEKSIRELDSAFITILNRDIIPGGEKRRWFLDRRQASLEKRIDRSTREKTEVRFRKKLSRTIEHIEQLKNTGYILADILVSKTEDGSSTEEKSLKTLLNYDRPVFGSYNVRLYLKINEAYGRYNTHYLEMIGENFAKNNLIQFPDLPDWDMDMVMKSKNVIYMNYPVLNEMFGYEKKDVRNSLMINLYPEIYASKHKKKSEQDKPIDATGKLAKILEGMKGSEGDEGDVEEEQAEE